MFSPVKYLIPLKYLAPIKYLTPLKYIPYICHFFTRAKFLESKVYTKKRQFFALNP